jgi:hypothetical protein
MRGLVKVQEDTVREDEAIRTSTDSTTLYLHDSDSRKDIFCFFSFSQKRKASHAMANHEKILWKNK